MCQSLFFLVHFVLCSFLIFEALSKKPFHVVHFAVLLGNVICKCLKGDVLALQDVQGLDRKMLAMRRTQQNDVDHLDSQHFDSHQLPVSDWASLWQHRMPQKRPADYVEVNGAKRRRVGLEVS